MPKVGAVHAKAGFKNVNEPYAASRAPPLHGPPRREHEPGRVGALGEGGDIREARGGGFPESG